MGINGINTQCQKKMEWKENGRSMNGPEMPESMEMEWSEEWKEWICRSRPEGMDEH